MATTNITLPVQDRKAERDNGLFHDLLRARQALLVLDTITGLWVLSQAGETPGRSVLALRNSAGR
jgi:hypothetical protein